MTVIPWGRIAGIAAVLAALVWIGLAIRDSGKDAGIAKGEEARAELAAQLATTKAQATTCAGALNRISDETARGLAEADARAAAGERAAMQAMQAAKHAEAEAARALGALTAAKRTPACRTQLEMPLCDAIPLL